MLDLFRLSHESSPHIYRSTKRANYALVLPDRRGAFWKAVEPFLILPLSSLPSRLFAPARFHQRVDKRKSHSRSKTLSKDTIFPFGPTPSKLTTHPARSSKGGRGRAESTSLLIDEEDEDAPESLRACFFSIPREGEAIRSGRWWMGVSCR